MGQKIHPVGFRLGINHDFYANWYARRATDYVKGVQDDVFLRTALNNILKKKFAARYSSLGLTPLTISKKGKLIQIEIPTSNPILLIGPNQERIQEIVKELEQQFLLFKQQEKRKYKLTIQVKKITNPNWSAFLLAQQIVEKLETRTKYRKAVKDAIKISREARVKGIKIQVSGRLNGAEIARSEWVRKGRVPLHTLRSEIDYAYQTAQTTYAF